MVMEMKFPQMITSLPMQKKRRRKKKLKKQPKKQKVGMMERMKRMKETKNLRLQCGSKHQMVQ